MDRFDVFVMEKPLFQNCTLLGYYSADYASHLQRLSPNIGKKLPLIAA